MIRILTFYLLIVTMETMSAIATGPPAAMDDDEDYQNDDRFETLKYWIGKVEGDLKDERETRKRENRQLMSEIAGLMGNLTREQEARAVLNTELDSVKLKQEQETAARVQAQTELQTSVNHLNATQNSKFLNLSCTRLFYIDVPCINIQSLNTIDIYRT